MNDLLDLAVKTRNRRDNAVTLKSDHYRLGSCCLSNFEYGNSAVFVSHCEHTISDKAREALFRLSRFTGLKENWDSYGAAVPKAMTVLEAKRFVQSMDRMGFEPYFVSPGPNGEVMVEYRTDDSREAQVHFNEDGSQELLLVAGSDYPYEGVFDRAKFLSHLYGR